MIKKFTVPLDEMLHQLPAWPHRYREEIISNSSQAGTCHYGFTDLHFASLIKQTASWKPLPQCYPTQFGWLQRPISSTRFYKMSVPKMVPVASNIGKTFNRRLDILFGETVRNSDGRLHISCEVPSVWTCYKYCEATATGELLVDAAIRKIERLVKGYSFSRIWPYYCSADVYPDIQKF